MRALVIGGSGQVGGAIAAQLRLDGHEVVGTWRQVSFPGLVHCDLADAPEVEALVRDARPEAVYCASGATWVDGCEEDPDWARAANATGPLVAARAAGDVPFVFFSTDYVFDGAGGPYGEQAPTNPLSVYGRSKLEGEEALLGEFPRTVVVRTVGVFGPELQGKNFVYQLWNRLRDGERMRVPSDQIGTPTYGPDLASATIALVEGGHTGVFHIAGPDLLSREAFARLGCEVLGLDASLLDPVTTPELAPKAARPLQGGLRCEALAAAGIAPSRPARAGLEAMRDVLLGENGS